MKRVLSGLEVLCLIDDVLVFGRDQEEHDHRLNAVLGKIQAAGATLNRDKCEFSKTQPFFQVTFGMTKAFKQILQKQKLFAR